MTLEIAIVLGVLLCAVILIASEVLSIDLVAVLMIVVMVAAGILSPEQAFSGFASDVVVALAAIFVIAGTIARAGLTESIAVAMLAGSRGSERAGLGLVMAVSVGLSTVFSNTSTASVLTPVVLSYARRAGLGAGRLLMPMAFASMMGGTMTLIGTSTNLSASGMVTALGMAPFAFFEFTAIGAILAVAGLLFMIGPGRLLVPDRRPPDLVADYGVTDYLTEIEIAPGSSVAGLDVAGLELERAAIEPLAILRQGTRLSANPLRIVLPGDRMIVTGGLDALLRLRQDKRFALVPEGETAADTARSDLVGLAEAVVLPQSLLVGRRLGGTAFFRRRRLKVLGLHRAGSPFATRLDNMTLRVGDVLLLQGATDDLESLKGNPDLRGLAEVDPLPPSKPAGLAALGLLTAAVGCAVAGLVPLPIGLLGVVAILGVFGITPLHEAYRMIDWRLLVTVAGMTAFGLAMYQTGAADFLAVAILRVSVPFGVPAGLFVLGLLTVLLTQPMSNAAAAITMLPVAVASADLMQIDPRPAVVLVTLSASLSFVAPLEPALLIVYGPGRYRFVDFIRAGGPLTLVTLGLLVVLVPRFWPL
ncbi:hypothetical protein KUH32_05050 [Thalassococcus sp. CAU 1522]|uniref:RCK C-terminal domain-containing protein n=1 Tax=Thalassococcus arenae TaxID=2851652 RepID=A0ABS6N559_9RHOB|nr:SLC13 family permease [Thalassococcus arenae]MBV2359135.1 hypothetical protein [Thalassococcus arenae]